MSQSARHGTEHKFQQFATGVKSRIYSEQLVTVQSTPNLLRDNPFPTFVNQIFVKLSECFHESSNELRLVIAIVLANCKQQLPLVISKEVILKNIFHVSHSNDPQARALVLQMLTNLAPLFPDNKMVHHLISETLSASNEFEFKCACNAMTAFVQVSSGFSSTIAEKLSTLLLSPSTSLTRKTLLVPVFARMKANIDTTNIIFTLCSMLLETSTENILVCSLLDSMTVLAEATRYAIPGQVGVLLDAMSRSENNIALTRSALINLVKLARHSYLWDVQQLKKLREAKLRDSSPAFYIYLLVLVRLSSKSQAAHYEFWNSILDDLRYLMSSYDLKLRIASVRICCNVYRNQPSDNLRDILVDTFMSIIGIELEEKQSAKFYHTLGTFMCCVQQFSEDLVTIVLSQLLDIGLEHKNIQQLIMLLCLLADKIPYVREPIRQWALVCAKTKPELLGPPLWHLLVLPAVNITDFDSSLLISGVRNDYDRYIIARTALRNGHWRSVALPFLETIDISHLSMTSSKWIEVLRELATSELRSFTVIELCHQRDHLLRAYHTAQILEHTSSDSSPFLFPTRFLECLYRSSREIHCLVAGLQPRLDMCLENSGKAASYQVSNFLKTCSNSLMKVISMWAVLQKSSYGAYQESLDIITYLKALYGVVLCAMKSMAGLTISPVIIPKPSIENAFTKQMGDLLTWAKGQLPNLQVSEINNKSIIVLLELVRELCMYRIGLPRTFFQQETTLNIRLVVVSGKDGELQLNKNKITHIQIDGFVSSNKPVNIESVTVTAAVTYLTMHANATPAPIAQSVSVDKDNYFTTQFMMKFPQSAQVDFTVDFVDGSLRQKWVSHSTAMLKVNVNE